jgi:hypothetical protein
VEAWPGGCAALGAAQGRGQGQGGEEGGEEGGVGELHGDDDLCMARLAEVAGFDMFGDSSALGG